MFVYLITNKINGKKYVGQHSGLNLDRYWAKHVNRAISSEDSDRAIYGAVRKYGAENFEIKPLVIVGTKEDLDYYEIGLIKALNTKVPYGYNLTEGGEGVLNPSQETRLRMSEAQKGKKQSESTKLKRANKLKGQTRSEETKKNISESLKGNQNCLGRIESEETRRKKSEINKGNKNALGAVRSPEYCLQKSLSQIGHKFSEETKKKMSESAKKRKDTDATRKKKSDNAIRLGLRPPQLSREQLAQAGRISCHRRCHVNKGIVNPQCALCREATNGTTAPEHSRSLENATQC